MSILRDFSIYGCVVCDFVFFLLKLYAFVFLSALVTFLS